MASVVVQQSPALTPTGGPPSSSPFVLAPDSSPYSRPHPPTTSDSHFPGSYPSETQLKEPKDAIDHLADAAPQSGGSVLPVPGAVMQGVQNVLSAMNETAKAYLPASIGNALPVGTTDPNVIEAETQNPNSYAVPSDLPTASSSMPIATSLETSTVPVVPVVETLNRTGSFGTDADVQASGAQIGNVTGLASRTAGVGLSGGLDPDASTRSLAPSSVEGTTTTAVKPFVPDNPHTQSTFPSTPAPTPLPKDSPKQLLDSSSELKPVEKKESPPKSSVNEIRPTVPDHGNNDVASSTISNLDTSSVSAPSTDSVRSGVSETVSDGYEDETSGDEGDGDASNEKGEKKGKAKRFVQKMKGKLHMGH